MVVAALGISLILVVGIFWYSWRCKNRRLLDLSDQIPGPRAYPLVGNGLVFMAHPKDNQKNISKIFEIYGDYMRFWLGPQLNVGIKNPTDIRSILTGNKTNQRGPLYEFLEDFIGPGILSGGPTWRKHRKMVNPTYNKKAIQHFAIVFNKEASLLASKLTQKNPGVTFDIYHDVVESTTQAVCQTLMGLSKEDSKNISRLDYVVKLTPRMYELIFQKMTRWWLQIPLIFWISGKKSLQNDYIKAIDEMTTDILEKRRRAMAAGEVIKEEVLGVVDRFILSGELTDKEIRQETFTLFTTSQEASAKIASAVLLFLARLPDWQSKVYEEVLEVVGPEADIVSEEHLQRLPYLDMVFKEALRYLSIAAIIQRSVEEDVAINDGNIIIPVGASILIPIQDLHRDPRYWEEPNKVMPERFLPENVHKRDPNAFIPFSLGPMDCIGRVFAVNLIKTFVVHVIRRIHLETDEILENLDIDYAISAKFAAGYKLRVRQREV